MCSSRIGPSKRVSPLLRGVVPVACGQNLACGGLLNCSPYAWMAHPAGHDENYEQGDQGLHLQKLDLRSHRTIFRRVADL